jgi:uncharacterized membrane protein
MVDKKSNEVLTDYDITINSIHQENMFKGTIAICIVYAIFAFILVSAAYFSDNIRELLFDKFLPFTLVYIIGTIVIIMIFIYYIVSFVPKKVDKNKIDDSISCPDYWKLEILDDKAIDKSFDIATYNKKLFKYRCVMDDAVFNKGAIYKQDIKNKKNEQYRLGNKPAFITNKGEASGNNGDTLETNYNDLLPADQTNLKNFLDNASPENDKYYYLYKNLNAYNNANLIYTNNRYISKNIINDLKNSTLIMNNYKIEQTSDKANPKYVDITNAGANIHPNTLNALDSRFTSNYYNSPPILTWATSNAHNNVDFTAYNNNSPLTHASDIKTYTSTVYDWRTMDNKTTSGYIYAIDFTYKGGNNFVLLGEINEDSNNNIYFKGNTLINVPASVFTQKINNNIYYFDDTYIISSHPTANISIETANGYKKGPKVRLFHKTERQPEILYKDLEKENIPLVCSAVYPSFMASNEDKYAENNTLRCAYSKICNIPWSDLHCNEIALQ